MSKPKVTHVTAFKSEATTELYESYEDAAVAEAAYFISVAFGKDSTLPDSFNENSFELAQHIANNLAEWRAILRTF